MTNYLRLAAGRWPISTTFGLVSAGTRKKFLLLLLVHFVATAWFTSFQAQLFDESDYFGYTVNWVKGHPERNQPLYDSKTPAMWPALLPAVFKPVIQRLFHPQDFFFFLKAGRPFLYVYQAFALFILFIWLFRLFGERGWFWPVTLFAFDPLVMSYGMIIGSDIASMAVLLGLMYAAWRLHGQNHSRRYFLMVAVLAAVGVVVKASLVYAYGLLLILFVISLMTGPRRGIWNYVKRLLVFAAIQLLVFNLAFYFKGSGALFKNIHFASKSFNGLQQQFQVLGNLPVPLPAAFIDGFDQLKFHAEAGGCFPYSTYDGVWLLGRESCSQPIWYFYLVTAVFKMPLLVWLLIAAAMIGFLRKPGRIALLRRHVYLWVPFVYFGIILSFFNHFQTGIRHALLLMPFLFISLSPLINRLSHHHRKLFYGLLIFQVFTLARYWPNLIAYTNELVANKTMAYNIFRDSSLDYGQTSEEVKAFIIAHPGFKPPVNRPDTGYFAVTVNRLFSKSVLKGHDVFWLGSRFTPYGHHDYTILLFHISEADLRREKLR